MKLSLITLSVITVVSSLSISPMANAQSSYNSSYNQNQCSNSSERTRNKIGGGFLGSVAGGLLGKEIAGDKNETLGITLGALGGAIIGSEIAKNLTKCDKELVEKTSKAALETGTTKSWSNSTSGRSGTVSVSPNTVQVAGHENEICRDLNGSVSDPSAASKSSAMTMCKGSDGVWKRV